ncbi:hypothetical protein IC582_022290 [Cucumis melo]
MELSILSCMACLIVTPIIIHLLASRKKPNLPPGPRSLPIIGNLLDIGDKPHKYLADLAKIYGPIASLKLGQVNAIVVSSPETIRQVLETHDHVLSTRAIPDGARVLDHDKLGTLWVAPVSPIWKNVRKLFKSQLFSPKSLEANESIRRAKIEDLLSSVRQSAVKGEVVDVGAAAFTAVLNMMSCSIWSMDLADTNSEMVKQFKSRFGGVMEAFGKTNVSDFFPVVKKFDIQGVRRRNSVRLREMFDLIDEMIDGRLKMQESLDFTPKFDALHHLLNLDEEKNGEFLLDRNQIRHLILDLFVAGTDTSATIIQWAMAYLLQNPKVMSKAKEELNQIIGRGNAIIEESQIEKLPYLQAIIKETLRLQSSLLLPRKSQSQVTISGYTIPKGTQIIVNLWALGRDSNIWEQPNCFMPERFFGDLNTKGRDFGFIPFGSGRRICPGKPLGVRVVHLIVGSLVHWFDWKLEDGVTPENLNMDDKFKLTLEMAQPLRAIPLF